MFVVGNIGFEPIVTCTQNKHVAGLHQFPILKYTNKFSKLDALQERYSPRMGNIGFEPR